MVLALTAAQQSAIEAGTVMCRRFLHFDALESDGTTPAPIGFYDDLDVVQVTVDSEVRTYYGSGTLIQVGSLSFAGSLAIPGLQVTLSPLPTEVETMIRGYIVAQRPMDLMVGVFDPDTRGLIGDLIPRFTGFVDRIEFTTPEAGGDSTVSVTCESASRALTVPSYELRSHVSQELRDSSDTFNQYTNVQRERTLFFGQKGPRR